jgi:signal recognition particle receptor subunit beta
MFLFRANGCTMRQRAFHSRNMASLNPLTRELVFKIVFYGPGLGGKTTTLQYIHGATKAEHRGQLVSLATPTDRTLYFDFLPVRVEPVQGMHVRLQLFTVPGQVYYSATRKLVLTGADGVVFVADSQSARADANQEALEDLNTNLAEHGRALSKMPHTFQWNKRDIKEVASIEELDRRFNLFSAPSVATVATNGEGVFKGLEEITKLVIEAYKAEMPRVGPDMAVALDEADSAGIADAIRGLAESPKKQGDYAIAGEPGQVPMRPPSNRGNYGTLPAGSAPTVVAVQTRSSPIAPPPSSRVEKEKEKEKIAAEKKPVSDQVPTVAPTSSLTPGFSMAHLWAEGGERESARRAEQLIAANDSSGAVLACDLLLARMLASAAGLAGAQDAPREPGLVCLLLGLDGRRYLSFRATVRAARGGEEIGTRDALECFTFILEARRARDSVR